MDMEKGRAGVVLLFPFFVIKEGLWSETGCKKAQKKIIPAVPFAFIISLACLTAPNRILSSFRSAGNGPHTIQPVLPIIHLFCHILGTHPLTFVFINPSACSLPLANDARLSMHLRCM